jgi:hypothetical protein
MKERGIRIELPTSSKGELFIERNVPFNHTTQLIKMKKHKAKVSGLEYLESDLLIS